MTNTKKKILLFIKVPPPYTGATLMNTYVRNSKLLNLDYNISSIDISYNKNVTDFGENNLSKLCSFIKYLFILIKKLYTFKPDLVYFQISPAGVALKRDLLFALLIKLTRTRIVYHLHGKGIDNEVTKSKLIKSIIRFAFNNEEIICLSELVTSDISKVYNKEPHILADGIPEFEKSLFDFSKRNNTPPIILFYSNFSVYKGLLILLDALNLLNEEKVVFKAVVAGRDADLTYEDVKGLITKLNLNDKIELLKDINHIEKTKLFNRADIFVFPTIFEAFGLVVLEAMQFALPIVASDEGSLPIIIKNEFDGLISKKGNFIDLAEKIKLLLLNKKHRLELGENGKINFKLNYSLDIFEKKLIQIFNKILIKPNIGK